MNEWNEYLINEKIVKNLLDLTDHHWGKVEDHALPQPLQIIIRPCHGNVGGIREGPENEWSK